MPVRSFILLLVTALLIVPSPVRAKQTVLEQVVVQLDWKYQFQYAGFIMAREKGFYAKQGLDVSLLEYQPGTNIVHEVLSRNVNYGMHNSSLIVEEKEILPIVLLASYFQRSPLVFVTQPNIKTPADLRGKVIMGTSDELKYSSLALLLSHYNISPQNTSITAEKFSIDDFIDGKVDAMSAFLSNQIYELNQRKVAYNIINPADYGFIMSAANLFTSQEEALKHTGRTRRFLQATNKGWHYAFDHPEETIQIIHNKYAPQKPLDALRFEANVTRELFLLDLYPIGTIKPELTSLTYKQLLSRNIIDSHAPLPAYQFDDVIEKHNQNTAFTTREQQFLDKKKVIRVCVDPEWMPFEGLINGKHYGISADYLSLFQEKLPIPLEVLETSSWQESLDAAKARRCDIFSLAARTPERSTYMDFTHPYVTLPVVIATTMDKIFIDDIGDIIDQPIGVVKGYAIGEQLRAKYPNANIVEVNSISDGLERVESGELYCYVDNLMVIAEQIQKEFTSVIKISGRVDDKVALAIGTRNDQPELLSIFDKLIHTVTPEQEQEIYNRWSSVKQEMGFNYTLFWKIFGVLAFIAGVFSVHYYQLRKYNQRLLVLSETDKLTGLANRLKLDKMLLEQEQLFVRYQIPCGVIIFDIDHFKTVNDTYGHPVGDQVLKEIAQLIRENIRVTDHVGRWGGEEFLIIAPSSNREETEQLADKLLSALRNHQFDQVGTVTASFGVCALRHELSASKVLSLADKALYQAKAEGRNRVISCVSE
ncbi:diguanylate cyclase [Desulfuromonas acetoxidans]|uniref:diguanylate cyclase n=1 Tax=Desulfuromonas acetoxidans (strain DSM 684 / 11070) TaxID=281689 RepID=Q1JVL7_DESA6|nr:diguanylate cyclase [Desulfuromonas acetoxidans]EAT14279.1 diguanylate cyclase [Desulfuromonas acetoxidans DSM 684]MBF0646516.1 diguanylate cyclase [Desulfuromonas acetoxidans]NVD24307.1 diguanylate cyclase [Desulfuromonas acetoxidans]NVE14920.1 diguanylate cyclase [Desulfuromonas acetoxidans]